MNRNYVPVLAVVLAVLTAAPAATETQPPVCAALAMRDCAPWDGPAFRIFVAEPTRKKVVREASWLEIAIWRTPNIGRSTTLTFPDSTQKTGAVLFEGSGFPSVKGTVTFRKATFGTDVEGEFDLTAPDGRHITGRFRAPWLDDVPLCG